MCTIHQVTINYTEAKKKTFGRWNKTWGLINLLQVQTLKTATKKGLETKYCLKLVSPQFFSTFNMRR